MTYADGLTQLCGRLAPTSIQDAGVQLHLEIPGDRK